MSIFSSLRTVKTSLASLGHMEVQPVRTSLTYRASMLRNSTNDISTGITRVADLPLLRLSGTTYGSRTVQRTPRLPISTAAQSLINNRNFVLPRLRSEFNRIQPTYKPNIKPKNVFRHEGTDDARVANKEFDAYEKLTGISHERPEIILLTGFQPLFIKDVSHSQPSFSNVLAKSGQYPFMSDAGWYCEAQINIRNLQVANVIQTLRSIRNRRFSFRLTLGNRKRGFRDQMDTLSSTTKFLLGVVKKADQLKSQLDLRDDIYETVPARTARDMNINFRNAGLSSFYNEIQQTAAQYMPKKYDISDVLVRLGYKQQSAREIFSSTKLWLQMLKEYKDILQDHSLEFLDIEPVQQRTDDNATVITTNDVRFFNISLEDPQDLPFLSEIVGFQPQNVRSAAANLRNGFNSIYERGARFRSEEARIAALANIVCREFRYSRGLTSNATRRALADHYNYTIQPNANVSVFDNIIGQFVNNVTEVPSLETNSLSGLAQRRPAENVAVLPFESKYLEGDNGLLTPGSDWYVDHIFRTDGTTFDTSRLSELSDSLYSAHKNFSIIATSMNLYASRNIDATDRRNKLLANSLEDPGTFVDRVLERFIDNKGDPLPFVVDDRLTAVFQTAATSPALRSLLFLLLMNRVSRSYYNSKSVHLKAPLVADNTPFTDAIVKRISRVLEIKTRRLSLATLRFLVRRRDSVDSNDLTSSAITNALRKGTKLTKNLEDIMIEIYDEFRRENAISASNDRSVYSGHMDTVIMMTLFDVLVAIIARYGNQEIVGRTATIRSRGNTNYVVASKSTNHRSSTNDLVNRLKAEVALTQQITWCVLNATHNLANRVRGFANYLSRDRSVAQLQALTNTINSPTEIQHLLTEQQIMLLGSTISDVVGKFETAPANPFTGDADGDGDFDADDQIKILDDSRVPPELRSALFGMFSTDEFAGSKGINKRIMTVGLPLGFARRLQQKVTESKLKRSSFRYKQNDIVQISVWKIDMINQDIVYKPLKFLFELSRFPVRDENKYRQLPDIPSFEQIAAAIPTRDYEEAFEEGTSSVAYWKANESESGTQNALDAESYSFLTAGQKAEIITNHLTSHMLEVYLRLMTGINTAEHAFDIDFEDDIDDRTVETEFVRLAVENKVEQAAKFIEFSPPSTNARILDKPNRSRNTINPKNNRPAGGILFSSSIRRRLASSSSLIRHTTITHPRTLSLSGVQNNVPRRRRLPTLRTRPVLNLQQFKKSKPAPTLRRRDRKSGSALSRNSHSLETMLTVMSRKKIPMVVQGLRNIGAMSRMRTSISDGLKVSKQMLRPKQFDRVFNLVIDPDDFEIDYDKTHETEHGRVAFEQLIKRQDVVVSSQDALEAHLATQRRRQQAWGRLLGNIELGAGQGVRSMSSSRLSAYNSNFYKFRDRDRNEGDVMFEKYFVTIETLDEEDV